MPANQNICIIELVFPYLQLTLRNVFGGICSVILSISKYGSFALNQSMGFKIQNTCIRETTRIQIGAAKLYAERAGGLACGRDL